MIYLIKFCPNYFSKRKYYNMNVDWMLMATICQEDQIFVVTIFFTTLR